MRPELLRLRAASVLASGALAGCISMRAPAPAVDGRGAPITAWEIRVAMRNSNQATDGVVYGFAGAAGGALLGGLLGAKLGCAGAGPYDDTCGLAGFGYGFLIGAAAGGIAGGMWGTSRGFDKDRLEAIQLISLRRRMIPAGGLDSALSLWLVPSIEPASRRRALR